MNYNEEVITTNVKARQLIRIAKECLEDIIRRRNEDDEKWLINFMKERNEATYFRLKWPFWYKKYDIKNTKEAREILDNECREQNNRADTIAIWWKSERYYPTYNEAARILKHYKHDIRNMDSVYTIPIEIYNNMASFCKPNAFTPVDPYTEESESSSSSSASSESEE